MCYTDGFLHKKKVKLQVDVDLERPEETEAERKSFLGLDLFWKDNLYPKRDENFAFSLLALKLKHWDETKACLWFVWFFFLKSRHLPRKSLISFTKIEFLKIKPTAIYHDIPKNMAHSWVWMGALALFVISSVKNIYLSPRVHSDIPV